MLDVKRLQQLLNESRGLEEQDEQLLENEVIEDELEDEVGEDVEEIDGMVEGEEEPQLERGIASLDDIEAKVEIDTQDQDGDDSEEEEKEEEEGEDVDEIDGDESEEEEGEETDEIDNSGLIVDNLFNSEIQVEGREQEILDNLRNALTSHTKKGTGKWTVKGLAEVNRWLPQALKVGKIVGYAGKGTKMVLRVGNGIIDLPDVIADKVYNAAERKFKKRIKEGIKKAADGSPEKYKLKKLLKLIPKLRKGKNFINGVWEVAKGFGAFEAGPEWFATYIGHKITQQADKIVTKTGGSKLLKKVLPIIGKQLAPGVSAVWGGMDIYRRNVEKGDSYLVAALKGLGGGASYFGIDLFGTWAAAKTGGIAIVPVILTSIAADLANWEVWTSDKTITTLPQLLEDYKKHPEEYEKAIGKMMERDYNSARKTVYKGTGGSVTLPTWEEVLSLKKGADGYPVTDPDTGGGGSGGGTKQRPGRPDDIFTDITQQVNNKPQLGKSKELQKKVKESKELRETKNGKKRRQSSINDYIKGQGG